MSYIVNQVVKVFRWASAGYGRVLELPNEKNPETYSVSVVQKDGWAHLCLVKPEDLKPGTKHDEKKMLVAEADIDIEARREQMRKDNLELQELLLQLAQEDPGPERSADEVFQQASDVAFSVSTGSMFEEGPVFGADNLSPLEGLRLQDDLSRSTKMTSGYRGCKKISYSAGDRVRPRTGMCPELQVRFHMTPGQTGTVAESEILGLLDLFPVSPLQPSGVYVVWDNGSIDRLVYVTEIEEVP